MKYSKIELWVASVFFAVALYVGLTQGFSSYGYAIGRGQVGIGYFFSYVLPNLALPVTTFGAFLTLNYLILPRYWFQKKHLEAIGLTLLLLTITGTIFMVAESYLRDWIYDTSPNIYAANMSLLSRGFSLTTIMFVIYGVYVLLREAILYQYRNYLVNQTLSSRIIREVILTFSVWFAVLVPIMAVNTSAFFNGIGPFYITIFPFCFFIYFLNLYLLIPLYKKGALRSVSAYLSSLTILALVLGVFASALLMSFRHQFNVLGYFVIYWLPPMALAVSLSWWVYLANAKTHQQLTTLKTALGTSDANLQFLRSQINPHFLFNALNTLYGTALTEKADKTGEGIQKLGDMMRFMLHENTQEMIPLNREIDYLHNYIDLQNLRIAMSDNIEIKTAISDKYNSYNIAPMLLIPFIENAYKHGISFKEKSWINVSLQLHGDTVLLDVYNSVHPVHTADPEEARSGIGLENVKQRLKLLYADKHELVIRQNQNEFFIHLRVQLS